MASEAVKNLLTCVCVYFPFCFRRVENIRLFLAADEANDGKFSTRWYNDGRPLRQDASSDPGSLCLFVSVTISTTVNRRRRHYHYRHHYFIHLCKM